MHESYADYKEIYLKYYVKCNKTNDISSTYLISDSIDCPYDNMHRQSS